MKTIDKSSGLKWLITLLAPICVLLVPTSATFTSDMRLFFVLTLLIILIMAFELTPLIVPSLAFPLVYLISGLAPANVVFAPWLNAAPWMTISGLILASIISGTGLLKRGAFWCIVKSGCSYNGILYALMFAGILFNLFIPGQALVPMAVLTFSICQALELGKSTESAGIMLAGFFGATIPMFFFYSSHFVMFQSVGMAVTDVSISWIDYFFQNIMLVPWAFIVIFMVTKVLKPKKDIKSAAGYFKREYDGLGAWKPEEKRAAILCIALILLLVTNNIHKIQAAWIFMLLVCVSFLPGINIGTKESLEKVNYPFIFLITGCMAIGEVSNLLGIGKWISDMLMPVIAHGNTAVILAVAWFLAFAMNFILSPIAIAATFTAPLTQIALDLSINPLVFYYSMIQGAAQVLLPYEWPFVMVFFSFGLIPMKDFVKLFSIKTVVNFIYFLVILIPFWKLIHLI